MNEKMRAFPLLPPAFALVAAHLVQALDGGSADRREEERPP